MFNPLNTAIVYIHYRAYVITIDLNLSIIYHLDFILSTEHS